MSESTKQELAPASTGSPASRGLEIALALAAFTFSAVYLYLGRQITLRQEAVPGQIDARFWPVVLGVVGIATSLALLTIAATRGAQSRDDTDPIQPGGYLRVVITCLLTVGFIALWSIGSFVVFGYRIRIFPIITVLFVISLMLIYGHRKTKSLIIFPLAISALIYGLFGLLLRVPL